MLKETSNIVYSILFLFFASQGAAQSTANTINALNEIDHFSQEKEWVDIGGDIRFLLEQDSLGYIWFASPRGLGRYDGANFKYFIHDVQNPNGIVNGFIETILPQPAKNRVLLGYESHGFHIFNLLDESSTKFRSNKSDSHSLSIDHIVKIYEDHQNRIWLITYDGMLHHFDEKNGKFNQVVNITPEQNTNRTRIREVSMLQDLRQEHVYWISSYFGLQKFDRLKKSITLFKNNLGHNYSSSIGSTIFQDDQARIWFSYGENTNLQIFDTKSETWVQEVETKSSAKFISQIEAIGDSTIIASAPPYDLIFVNSKDLSQCMIRKVDQGFQGANALAIDQNNGINLISNKGTIIRSQSNKSPFQKRKILFQDKVFANSDLIYNKHNQQYYFSQANGNGLLVTDTAFQTQKVFRITNNENEVDHSVNTKRLAFTNDDNILWLATNRGIKRFDINRQSFFDNSNISHSKWDRIYFHKIIREPRGLWFFSMLLMVFLDERDGTFREYHFNEFAPNLEPFYVQFYKDLIIFASNNGFEMFDRTSKLPIDFQVPDQFTFLKDVPAFSIAVEADTIWMGTQYDGLYKLIAKKNNKFDVSRFYNLVSPASNVIQEITIHGKDIWLTDKTGFQKYDRSKNDALVFNHNDGIDVGARTTILRKGHDGLILNPAINKIHYFNQAGTQHQLLDPYLVSISANGEKILRPANLSEVISLSFNQKDLLFEIGALNHGSQNENFYRYRLLNYDKSWTYVGARNYINFTNLSAGKYTFEFNARSFHSHWSENPQQVHFEIASHFLLTWWFKIIWTLLAITLIGLIIRFYQNKRDKEQRLISLQKERVEAELKALRAQMNPHFLFNTLNSINWYIIKNKPLEASKYLTKFSKLMRLILDNSKLKTISLKNELESLRLYVELELVRFEGKFDYVFDIDPDLDTDVYQIPPLLLQPFVENAIWHGLLHRKTTGKIILKIEKMPASLLCTIEDNGIGRKASAALNVSAKRRKSSGIDITSKRILSLNQSDNESIKIIDLEDKNGTSLGTKVSFLLPLRIEE